MSPTIDITVEAGGWQELPGAEAILRQAAIPALRGRAEESAELSILLTDDRHMCALNRVWRGIDKPTNVLAFPAPAAKPRMLGDVVIAYETVAREAKEIGISPADHLAHLTVHGILHLLGYDHERQSDAEIMESAEREILAALGIADPYEQTRASTA